MKKRVLSGLLAVGMVCALLAGCGSKAEETTAAATEAATEAKTEAAETEAAETEAAATDAPEVIKVAGTGVSEVFYQALKEKYEGMGYKTEFIAFDSNPVCLEACASGETNVSLGQQVKFAYSYNENNGANLDMVKPYAMFTGIGLYSEQYASVDEIPEGSQIAVMNDAVNEDVALRILEAAGLIKLAEDVDLVTVADIVENPKNLEIMEMDQAQTVTALTDMAAACCWFTHMSAAGKDPSTYLVREDVMVNYPMGVIVNGEDATSEWAVAMAECFRDADVQAAINEVYPNVFEFYTSDDQVDLTK
ncbi:MAG: methionine-binding protein [Lachnospiraceae bacterium]|nr:methionine-binding protein [Lachnospiraceae bacterium]